MFVLCALVGFSQADPRLFLPNAIAPGQHPGLRHGQRAPVETAAAYMNPGAGSEYVGFGAPAGREMPRVVPGAFMEPSVQTVSLDASPQMPTAWALTGAVVVGLSMYG